MIIGEEEDEDKEEMDRFYREQIDEFEKARDDFFEDEPVPETEEESLKQQEEFIQWYNTERKQSDTGMTPEETGTMFGFEREKTYTEKLREAQACLERKEYNAAGGIADEVLEHDPENKMALQILTQSRMLEGDLDRGEKILDRWENIYSEDPYIFLLRAMLCIMKMDFLSALEEVNNALKIEQDFFDAVIMKAQILDLLDDERAEDLVEKARGLDEEHTEIFLEECWLTDYVEEEKECGSPNSSKLLRVESLLQSGETEKARELISELEGVEDSIDLEGIKETINRVEFDTLLREGEIDEVDEKMSNKLESEPENTLYLYYSAQVHYLKGDIEKALQRIDESLSVIEEKEDDQEIIFSFKFHFLKAEILRSMGDENWERWHEKAERLKRESLKGLEGSYMGTDTFRISGESRRQNQKDKNMNGGNEAEQEEERKEKTLDEFL